MGMYSCTAPVTLIFRRETAVEPYRCAVEAAIFVQQVVVCRFVLGLVVLLVVVWRLHQAKVVRVVVAAVPCRSHPAVPLQAQQVLCRWRLAARQLVPVARSRCRPVAVAAAEAMHA